MNNKEQDVKRLIRILQENYPEKSGKIDFSNAAHLLSYLLKYDLITKFEKRRIERWLENQTNADKHKNHLSDLGLMVLLFLSS